tara:strand:+ start:597 stop:749 length:153 start_codon:yes stop_codon:yes gene_type:complete
MDDAEIKLKCLEQASTGDAQSTIFRAQQYYEWVTEKPKRGRPKKAIDSEE